jgi:hypothetical protein
MTKRAMSKDTFRRHSSSTPRSLERLLLHLLLFMMLIFTIVDASAEDEESVGGARTTAAQQRRNKHAKMWYLRRMQVGNTELPFSAVTLAIVFISIYYLISDHSEAGKKTLLEYQAKIQSDAALFAKHAQKFSSCASKNNGGNLVSCVPLLLACIGLHRC